MLPVSNPAGQPSETALEQPQKPPAAHQFPDTRESLVQALASNQHDARVQAFDLIVRAYRTPIVVLLSRKWALQHEDAEDIAQEFFARALEKDWFARYNSDRGRFRTFLRTCLTAFAADEHDRLNAQKRGGSVTHESLSDSTPQVDAEHGMDTLFEQEWIRSVLEIALDALRQESVAAKRPIAYSIFEQYDVIDSETRPTYAKLAVQWKVPTTQVTNYLFWARRRFRQHVLNTVRSLTGSEEEYQAEVRTLLGVIPE